MISVIGEDIKGFRRQNITNAANEGILMRADGGRRPSQRRVNSVWQHENAFYLRYFFDQSRSTFLMLLTLLANFPTSRTQKFERFLLYLIALDSTHQIFKFHSENLTAWYSFHCLYTFAGAHAQGGYAFRIRL
jgi:hypothetical protein